MKRTSLEKAAELIARLRKSGSEASDVALVRAMEENCHIQIILHLFFICAVAYNGSRESSVVPWWAFAGLFVLCCWSLFKGIRGLIEARAVRALFERAGPQFLSDLRDEARKQ
jgi:hypothetical protein